MSCLLLFLVLSGHCGSVLVSGQPTAKGKVCVDIDTVYDIALSLQTQVLNELKNLRGVVMSMQSQNFRSPSPGGYGIGSNNEGVSYRLEALEQLLGTQLRQASSKLETHDAYLKNATQELKSQLQSFENRLMSRLNTQDQNLNSRMSSLTQSLQLDLDRRFTAHGELIENLTLSEQFRRSCAANISQEETVRSVIEAKSLLSSEITSSRNQILGNLTRFVDRKQNLSNCDRFQDQLSAHDDRLQMHDRHLKTQNQFMKGIYDSVVGPRDCGDIRASGENTSGVFRVYPGNLAKRIVADVYCEMDTLGRGWLVFQRRTDGRVNFERKWDEYATGFGNISGEFWLGNDILHALTSNRNYKMWVDMEDFDGQKRYAEYGKFSISSAADNYRLIVASYKGNAGDSLQTHSGNQFSTVDADHDQNNGSSCAVTFHGAWWYKNCHVSNLNGRYLRGNHTSYADGINWLSFRGYHHSLKATRMKITPIL